MHVHQYYTMWKLKFCNEPCMYTNTIQWENQVFAMNHACTPILYNGKTKFLQWTMHVHQYYTMWKLKFCNKPCMYTNTIQWENQVFAINHACTPILYNGKTKVLQ